jgi:ankyrin repeat protein
MSGLRISLIRTLLVGAVLCYSDSIFSQNDTLLRSSDNVGEIDTSDYLSEFYQSALSYNLLIASAKGYSSEIDRLIAKGADVNTETAEKATPLIMAIEANSLSAVNTLLKYNPELNKFTLSYETPLIIAVKNGNTDICEALIRHGADIDLTDRNGATPLHIAALNGYLDVVDLLLYYDASIDQKSDEGLTPLMASIMAGYTDVADLLIQNGANMEARSNEGYTPFLIAAFAGDTLIMDVLFKHGVDIYATGNKGYNAIDLAISANEIATLKYLLRIGNKWGSTEPGTLNPYVVASKYRRKEMIPLLRENNIPGQVRYGIDQADFSVSSRFTLKDYYTGFSISFREPYLNAGIIVGSDLKLWHTRVLIKSSEHTYYQYLDKGYLIYAGLFKDFTLYENPFKSNLILTTSLLGGYSFGHQLKGTEVAPNNEFQLIPDITLKWAAKHFSVYMGMEYIKSQFYKIGPVWMRIGVSYTGYFDNIRNQVKPIKWY